MYAFMTSLASVLGDGFSPQELSLWQISLRSIVLYLVGIMIVRLGKSRMLSRYSALDVILGFILGSVLGRGISGAMSIPAAMVATASLVALHWFLTLIASRQHWIGNLMKGNATLLVSEGKIQWDAMRHSHMSEHDLMEELRSTTHLDDLQRVKTAYKERSGQVGIVTWPPESCIQDIQVQDGVQTVRIIISPSH